MTIHACINMPQVPREQKSWCSHCKQWVLLDENQNYRAHSYRAEAIMPRGIVCAGSGEKPIELRLSKEERTRMADYMYEAVRRGCTDILVGRVAAQKFPFLVSSELLITHQGGHSCF